MEFTKGLNKTKVLISFAIYQLIYRNVDFESITVKDICETAGVSRMSFYRYYEKKEDIFIDFCDEKFAEFYDDYQKSENKSGHAFVVGLFHYFKKYSRELLILKKANRTNLLMNQFNGYAKYAINRWKAVKESVYYSPVLPAFISGGFFNVLMNWIDNGMKEDELELTEQMFALFPLFTEKSE